MNGSAGELFDRLVEVCAPVVEKVAQKKEAAYPAFVGMLAELEAMILLEIGEKAREPFPESLKKSVGLVCNTPLEELTHRAIAQAAVDYYSPNVSSVSAIRKTMWEQGRDAVSDMHGRKKAEAGKFVQDFFANPRKEGRGV